MTLNELNAMPNDAARRELMRCCGSRAWVEGMLTRRPFRDEAALMKAADDVWAPLGRAGWLEAFGHHPRIGDRVAAGWASQEQAGSAGASKETLDALVKGNDEYEKRFRHVFLVCATGKSAGEMLAALEERLHNDEITELRIAAGEQAKITRLRLGKLLAPTTEPSRT